MVLLIDINGFWVSPLSIEAIDKIESNNPNWEPTIDSLDVKGNDLEPIIEKTLIITKTGYQKIIDLPLKQVIEIINNTVKD